MMSCVLAKVYGFNTKGAIDLLALFVTVSLLGVRFPFCKDFYHFIVPTFLASIIIDTIPSLSSEFLVSNRNDRPILPSTSFQYL